MTHTGNGHTSKRVKNAVVIGGSLTGLLAARVLSDHFGRVFLVERDKINDWPESRKGQPQTRHVHALLMNGLTIFTRYFPDLPDALRAGGAVLADVGSSLRWYAYGGYRRMYESGFTLALMSRPYLEWLVKQRVMALPNVTVLDQHEVRGLLTSDDNRRVTGVSKVDRTTSAGEEKLEADLVMDTTGRGSATPKWLDAMDFGRPEESSVKVGVSYTSCVFRRKPDDLTGATFLMISPHAPALKRGGFAFPMEDERWIVSLTGWAGDHAPTDRDGYLEYAKSLAAPDIAQLIPKLEPLTDIYVHKFPDNLRRRYERLNRFPEGFLVMGDAICSFNPVYGQGMTSAVMQAAALDKLLGNSGALEGIWKRFFKQAAGIVDMPWQVTVGEDFRFPETEGEKAFGTNLINAYLARLQRVTHHDPLVYGMLLGVLNLMAPPTSLFQPQAVWRVLRG